MRGPTSTCPRDDARKHGLPRSTAPQDGRRGWEHSSPSGVAVVIYEL